MLCDQDSVIYLQPYAEVQDVYQGLYLRNLPANPTNQAVLGCCNRRCLTISKLALKWGGGPEAHLTLCHEIACTQCVMAAQEDLQISDIPQVRPIATGSQVIQNSGLKPHTH